MSQAARSSAWQNVLTRVWLQRTPLAWLLWPISLIYAALVGLRQWLYRAGWLQTIRLPVPVIVVGNLVAGGAGKTPVVIALVEHLQQRGMAVGVIARGYGRSSTDCREVTAGSTAREVGDEPALVHRRTGAPVFVARRRSEAGQALLQRHPHTRVIVSDDGLQHLALQRDLEIGVFDNRGLGNGFLLPAGPLREPWPRPLDLLLHSGSQPAFAGWQATRALADHAVRADGSRVALAELARTAKPLLALAAIAQPEAFFAMLRAQGLTLARTLALPDHHDFSDWSPDTWAAYTLIGTEKDAVKLWPLAPALLAVPLQCTLPPEFWLALDIRIDALLGQTGARAALSSVHGHTTT